MVLKCPPLLSPQAPHAPLCYSHLVQSEPSLIAASVPTLAPADTLTTPSAEGDELFIISEEPPPGFEDIEEQEEETLIDVYYNNERLGQMLTTYSYNKIRFQKPQAIVDVLPPVTDKAAVTKALSGEIDAHSDLVCTSAKATDCGSLQPDVAGVIFNVEKLRADVFINYKYLTRPKSGLNYIPLPAGESGLSLIDSSRLNATKVKNVYNYNLNSQTTFAYKQSNLQIDTSYVKPQADAITPPFTITQLVAHHFFKRYQINIGMFDSIGNDFISNENLLGIGFDTLLDATNNLERGYSRELPISLAQRSQVNIFREGRLIYNHRFEAGHYFIDTRSFPNGAYDIKIQIESASGETEEREEFFVKNSRFPPLEYPFYSGSVGFLSNTNNTVVWPQFNRQLFANFGVGKRVSHDWGILGNIDTDFDHTFFSSGFFILREHLELEPQILVSNDSAYGFQIDSRYDSDYITGSARFRKIYADNLSETEPNHDPDNFRPINQPSTQANLFVSYRFSKGTLQFNARYNKRPESKTWEYGPLLRWNLLRQQNLQLRLELEATQSESKFTTLSRLRFSSRRNQLSQTTEVDYLTSDDPAAVNEGFGKKVNLQWQNNDEFNNGWQLHSDFNQPQSHDRLISLGSDYDGNRGAFEIDVDRNIPADGDASTTTNANGLVQFGIASGKFSVGGNTIQDSAILAHVDGGKSTDTFVVVINGRAVNKLHGNSSLLIPLMDFRTYKVSLRAENAAFYVFDETEREITLYPGNVKYFGWKLKEKIIISTRVLLPNGQPIKDALVEGGIGFNAVDADGFLQAEIDSSTKQLQVEPLEDKNCIITLPDYQAKEGYAELPNLTCVPGELNLKSEEKEATEQPKNPLKETSTLNGNATLGKQDAEKDNETNNKVPTEKTTEPLPAQTP